MLQYLFFFLIIIILDLLIFRNDIKKKRKEKKMTVFVCCDVFPPRLCEHDDVVVSFIDCTYICLPSAYSIMIY